MGMADIINKWITIQDGIITKLFGKRHKNFKNNSENVKFIEVLQCM